MAAGAPQPDLRPGPDLLTMHYRCSIYGLGVVANRPIPTVPSSPNAAAEVRVSFGVVPQLDSQHAETSYVADYQDDCGNPMLVVSKLADGKFYRFRYADRTEFVIDETGSEIWAAWPDTLTLEDTATYLLGPVMGFVLLLRGLFCLHASAIAVGDKAIALIGPAGAGKSTTAAAFSARGLSVLAEDVVTLDDCGDRFVVRPGYPCIRLWPASVAALYGHEAQLPRLTPNWDKCYLDLTQSHRGFEAKPLPLSAIYLLAPRSDDPRAPFVESLSRTEAMIALVANTYATKLMDKKMRAREFEVLGRVLANVPLRRVTPHTHPQKLSTLCDHLLADFERLYV
jgi:hypothetical protein